MKNQINLEKIFSNKKTNLIYCLNNSDEIIGPLIKTNSNNYFDLTQNDIYNFDGVNTFRTEQYLTKQINYRSLIKLDNIDISKTKFLTRNLKIIELNKNIGDESIQFDFSIDKNNIYKSNDGIIYDNFGNDLVSYILSDNDISVIITDENEELIDSIIYDFKRLNKNNLSNELFLNYLSDDELCNCSDCVKMRNEYDKKNDYIDYKPLLTDLHNLLSNNIIDEYIPKYPILYNISVKEALHFGFIHIKTAIEIFNIDNEYIFKNIFVKHKKIIKKYWSIISTFGLEEEFTNLIDLIEEKKTEKKTENKKSNQYFNDLLGTKFIDINIILMKTILTKVHSSLIIEEEKNISEILSKVTEKQSNLGRKVYNLIDNILKFDGNDDNHKLRNLLFVDYYEIFKNFKNKNLLNFNDIGFINETLFKLQQKLLLENRIYLKYDIIDLMENYSTEDLFLLFQFLSRFETINNVIFNYESYEKLKQSDSINQIDINKLMVFIYKFINKLD